MAAESDAGIAAAAPVPASAAAGSAEMQVSDDEIQAFMFGGLDSVTRQRLAWAMDGDAGAPYPADASPTGNSPGKPSRLR